MDQRSTDPVVTLNWLQDHMVILDQSELDSYEGIMEAVISVLHAAYNEAELAGTGDGLIDACKELTRAIGGRKGTGSALR